MNRSKQRKFAAMMSFLSALGHIGVIAVIINSANFKLFTEIIPTSPRLQFILLVELLSLIIGVMLLLPVAIGRKTLLAAFIVSVAIFATAAFQMSITLLLVLFWPWSLYKLYRSELV